MEKKEEKKEGKSTEKIRESLSREEREEIARMENKIEEEESRRAEEEEKTRQTFDPIKQELDMRKRRATDMNDCVRVTLPKPLKVQEEAKIELRRELHVKIFLDYIRDKTKDGEQMSNLSDSEMRGLKSLLKRIKNQELLILKTDKSGQFCVVSWSDYLEMGKVHTDKDMQVSRAEIIEIEKILNGHAVTWTKIFAVGLDHDHTDRIQNGVCTKSNNLASMYLLYKDHKAGNMTRPVVTGCSSNTRSLSDLVSKYWNRQQTVNVRVLK